MITGELRGLLADINWTEIIDHMQTSAGAIVDGDWLDAWHEAASNACDAIDAVHSNLERENDRLRQERDMRAAMAEEAYNRGYDEGFASADDWLGQHEDAMAEHGWVKLPVDSDGVPVCVGDVMEGEKIGGGYCEPFEVIGYIMSNGELEPMDEHKCPRKHKYLRHHHAPTVEDVLLELLDEAEHFHSLEEEREAIAEYAAKLRLAGDVE